MELQCNDQHSFTQQPNFYFDNFSVDESCNYEDSLLIASLVDSAYSKLLNQIDSFQLSESNKVMFFSVVPDNHQEVVFAYIGKWRGLNILFHQPTATAILVKGKKASILNCKTLKNISDITEFKTISGSTIFDGKTLVKLSDLTGEKAADIRDAIYTLYKLLQFSR